MNKLCLTPCSLLSYASFNPRKWCLLLFLKREKWGSAVLQNCLRTQSYLVVGMEFKSRTNFKILLLPTKCLYMTLKYLSWVWRVIPLYIEVLSPPLAITPLLILLSGFKYNTFSSVQFSCSVMSDSLWPMICSTPGLPVHHQLLESTQTHVHRVDDAIQPSHPLSSPSPPALNPSQYQGLFQWVSSSHEVAKALEFLLQETGTQKLKHFAKENL